MFFAYKMRLPTFKEDADKLQSVHTYQFHFTQPKIFSDVVRIKTLSIIGRKPKSDAE